MFAILKQTAINHICWGLFPTQHDAQECYRSFLMERKKEFSIVEVNSLEDLRSYILYGFNNRTVFEVFDNGKKAEMHGWVHPICTDFESAVDYAKKWLGSMASSCPYKPNQVVGYGWYGDTIEIREIS